jgi:hypothetical protein
MMQHFSAIFENGLLRPIVPLSLPDQAVVQLSMDVGADESTPNSELIPFDSELAAITGIAPDGSSAPWMRFAGMVETGDALSSQHIDEIVYGNNP